MTPTFVLFSNNNNMSISRLIITNFSEIHLRTKSRNPPEFYPDAIRFNVEYGMLYG